MAEQKQYLGVDLLRNPLFNKGLAFTEDERDKYKLRGLLPPRVMTIVKQAERVLHQLNAKPSPIEKYIYLISLQDRNETLFYYVLMNNVTELMPIVYTPTVGEACSKFGYIFRRPRGLYIDILDQGRVETILRHWPISDVRVIVVTDGERILGLGDLGAFGMGIPVGKLTLYTACAGVHPNQCLPITLDVGTDNAKLLEDPMYIGLPQKRVRGEQYYAFVDEFITATTKIFPKALIQFEDFGGTTAFKLLEHYRDKIFTFNDDIQGTASVTLAGILAASRITKTPLPEQRILFLGAGEAGVGIGGLIATDVANTTGKPIEETRKICSFVDSQGLVCHSRLDSLAHHKREFAHKLEFKETLVDAIRLIKPTVLIGVSAQPHTFTKEVVELMCEYNKMPVIMALSNPTSKAECTAEQAYKWSNGQCLFASGSPFDAVTINGKVHIPGQGNNSYIFPGVGLGCVAVDGTRVTDEMFIAASHTLANLVSDDDLKNGSLYPPLTKIREVSLEIAMSVAEIAVRQGQAKAGPFASSKEIREHLIKSVYVPDYKSVANL